MITTYIVPWGRYQGLRVRRVRGFHTADDFRKEYANLNPWVPFYLDATIVGRDCLTWDVGADTGDPCVVETLNEYVRFVADPGEAWLPKLIVEVEADEFRKNEKQWEVAYFKGELLSHLTVVAAGKCQSALKNGIDNAHACIIQFPGIIPSIRECKVNDRYIAAWGKEATEAKQFILSDAGSGWQYTEVNNTLNDVTKDDFERMMKGE